MIVRLLLNIALTLVWLLLWQSTSVLNAALGFVISALVISMTSHVIGTAPAPTPEPPSGARRVGYALRLINLVRFTVYFLYILVKANLEVAWEIITPGFHMQPRMIRYSVDGLSPTQVTFLASAITLTPGTLSADVDDDGRALFIHAMYAQQEADAVAALDELRDQVLWLVFGARAQANGLETP